MAHKTLLKTLYYQYLLNKNKPKDIAINEDFNDDVNFLSNPKKKS